MEEWIDRAVEKLGAVPVLNDVLFPALEEVGDSLYRSAARSTSER